MSFRQEQIKQQTEQQSLVVATPDIVAVLEASTLSSHPRLAAYLDTLERHLVGLSPFERKELREEAKQHLLALIAAHEELGEDTETAVEAALARFGETRQVARGIRREALRRQMRLRGKQAIRLIVAANLGAMAGLTFPVVGAPLLVAGNDLTVLYAVSGAGFGIAAVLRLRALAGALAGMMIAALGLTVACGLTLLAQEICPLFLLGMRWAGRETELACFLPALFLGALWGVQQRHRLTVKPAILSAVLAYAVPATLIESRDYLVNRPYISAGAAAQWVILSLILWASFGLFFGGLGVLCQQAVSVGLNALRRRNSPAVRVSDPV